MKKKIFLAFAVAACFGFLLACSSDPGDEPTRYTVSFDLNLSTATGMAGVTAADTPAPITVEQGKTVTLPTTITKSTSHNHTGWFVAQSGGTALASPYTPTKSIILYAQWESKGPTTYTVTFENNFPEGSTNPVSVTPTTKTVTAPATTVGTLPTAPSTGTHNFVKWTKNADGSGGDFDASTTVTASIPVYAQWREKVADGTVYTVTFNNNFPTESTTQVSVTPTSKTVTTPATTIAPDTLPTEPTTGTHNFIKWTKNANGTGGDFDADSSVLESFTVYAQWQIKPPTSAPVKVGTETQNVTVTGSTGATVTYITNGYRVATSTSYGPYASFQVNLGTGKSIANFKEVTFTYNPVSGDTGHKTLYLLASDETFPANVNDDTAYKTLEVAGSFWGENPEPNVVATIGKDQANIIPVLSSAEEINFSIYLHAEAASYEITNITFVPAPAGHQAVTAIAGVATEIKAGEEFVLSGFVFPPYATNQTIEWSLKSAGTTGVTEITDGKFTPAAGTIIVTATITGGGASSFVNYTQDFTISVYEPGAQISVNVGGTAQTGIPVSAKSGNVELDVIQITGGYQFTTGAGGFNTISYFPINLGTGKTYADITAVKATVDVSGSDPDYKKFAVTASATDTISYPGEPSETWNHGNSASEITLIKRTASVDGNNVYLVIYGHLPASQTVKITNIKIEF